MGTSYTNIFERFSNKIQDYTLDKIYLSSVTNYNIVLTGYLKNAIPKFKKCKQDLTNRDDSNLVFNITLTESEEEILAMLMQVEWYEKEISDIRQIRLALNDDGAFKRHAESQNLKAKMDSQTRVREQVDKLIVEYTYEDYDYNSWI